MGAYLLLYNMCCGRVKWGWGDGGDDGDGPAAPGIPLRSRCARPRPPYADAKGDGVDACAGGGRPALCPAPSPHRAYPASIASLARAPFAGSERGRAFSLALPFWIPACAGMTRWGGNDGGGMACARRPGHTPAVSLRSSASPLRWSEGGRYGFLPAQVVEARQPASPHPAPGIPREHRFARSRPFRWERKGQGVSPQPAPSGFPPARE